MRFDNVDTQKPSSKRNNGAESLKIPAPDLRLWLTVQQTEVVKFVRYVDGNPIMTIHYYHRPNWWERLNFWLSDYKAEWIMEEEDGN